MYVWSVDLDSPDFDPAVREIGRAIANAGNGDVRAGRAALIAAPPGFGKTSVLRAASRSAAAILGADVVWIPGGIVASDGHLSRLLTRGTQSTDTAGEITNLRLACKALGNHRRRVVIAIDDFDVLAFKRESISLALGRLTAQSMNVRLMASCRPEWSSRLVMPGHPFADAALRGGEIVVHSLAPLDDNEALALIRRRAPSFPTEHALAVIAEAGGHPAALVFLSRLAVLRPEATLADILIFAAEFAGAVYTEGWASLGPQQRAIVWELSTTSRAMTAAEIARSLDVPSAQVSSQLSRLVNEGLVLRTQARGQFTVARLLARWVSRRANQDRLTSRGEC